MNVDVYDGGDTLYCVVYLRLSIACVSPFRKHFLSITLSKNRLNLTASVVPAAKLRDSWQFKQIKSAPHCSAVITEKTKGILFIEFC